MTWRFGFYFHGYEKGFTHAIVDKRFASIHETGIEDKGMKICERRRIPKFATAGFFQCRK